jgi:hypothetical protein
MATSRPNCAAIFSAYCWVKLWTAQLQRLVATLLLLSAGISSGPVRVIKGQWHRFFSEQTVLRCQYHFFTVGYLCSMYVPPMLYTLRNCQSLLQLLTAFPLLKTIQPSNGFCRLIRVIISGYLWLSRFCVQFFYVLLTVHLDAILGNDQLDALFLNVFILRLYMFRGASAHHQEG